MIITGIFPPDIGGPATYVPQMGSPPSPLELSGPGFFV
jgi:hypothetical protein